MSVNICLLIGALPKPVCNTIPVPLITELKLLFEYFCILIDIFSYRCCLTSLMIIPLKISDLRSRISSLIIFLTNE